MGRIGVLLITALLLATGTAKAVTIQTTDMGRPWQAWASAAQVPTWQGTLPLTIAADLFDCGGMQASGCSNLTPAIDDASGQIMPQGTPLASVSTEIYNDPDAWQAKATLYHELGQVFWAEYLTTSDEARFMQIVGLAPDPYNWGNYLYGTKIVAGATYHFPPFEWFAEGYRYCAEYGINQPSAVSDEEGFFYPGDRATFAPQQRQVCQLIDEIGNREGIATPAQMDHTPTHLSGRVVKVRVHTTHAHRRMRPTRISHLR